MEFLLHLEYVPFLKIPKRVPTKSLLSEAKKLDKYFLPYLSGNQHWTTIALRSPLGEPGAPIKKIQKEPIKDTLHLDSTPTTVRFLKSIVEWEKSSRVRFLKLKAKGKINNHRETDDLSYFFSINISLNMPKGCYYSIDTNKDGTKNKYTKKVPFSDKGSVFLLNNARYHKVENASIEDRMHIQVIGPLKLDVAYLVKLARKQNRIKNLQDLITKLSKKKKNLNERILSDSPLNFFNFKI